MLVEQQGYFQINCKDLEYCFITHDPPLEPQRPALVLLHEGLGCVALWKEFPQQLACTTGCDVLVYSRFGYGNSAPVNVPRPIDYMHTEALQVLAQVLDSTHLNNVLLVGHSDGASIALIFAGGNVDERIKGMVLLAPHVFVEPLSIKSIEVARQSFLHGNLRRQLARYHGDNVDCAFWGWNQAWLDPRFLEWNIESFLKGIRVPVLLIQGIDDPYGTQNQLMAITRQLKGASQCCLFDDCGHAPHVDQPFLTLQQINIFVTGFFSMKGHKVVSRKTSLAK